MNLDLIESNLISLVGMITYSFLKSKTNHDVIVKVKIHNDSLITNASSLKSHVLTILILSLEIKSLSVISSTNSFDVF